MRLSASPTPTLSVQSSVVARPPEPAARKMEIDENYDDDDEEDEGVVSGAGSYMAITWIVGMMMDG